MKLLPSDDNLDAKKRSDARTGITPSYSHAWGRLVRTLRVLALYFLFGIVMLQAPRVLLLSFRGSLTR
jgi:hypothetical protein